MNPRIMIMVGGALAMLVGVGVIVGTPASTHTVAKSTARAAAPVSSAPTVGDAVPPANSATGKDTAPRARTARAESALDLARIFAEQQANWSFKTITRQYRRLSALATGELRTELRRAAEDTRLDATLRRDRTGSHGRVLGIDIRGGGGRRQIVVATMEEPYGAGASDLQGQHARVYLGEARRVRMGWVMSVWTPQP